MPECDHEPVIVLKEGVQWVESIICQCRRCGELVEFKPAPPKLKLMRVETR